jgi:hypothetical protein
MLGKIGSIPRKNIQRKLGELEGKSMRAITRGLAVYLGFG